MTNLILYSEEHHDITVRMIAEFFAAHYTISEHEKVEINESRLALAEENLQDWLDERDDEDYDTHIFLIEDNGEFAGILILKKHGGNVVWIEDLYVRAELQRRGIGSRAIALAEKYVTETMNVPAICMDVIPQNRAALKLYHKLGYDTISMVTLRKPVTEEKRSEKVEFMGYQFFK